MSNFFRWLADVGPTLGRRSKSRWADVGSHRRADGCADVGPTSACYLGLILSKFNHLFISVPVSDKFLKKINDLIYGYLWEGKPDKISRKTICANYFDGGLKMVNIFNFEKSLKLSWVKRMAKQDKADWYKLLQISIKKLKKYICSWW